MTQDILNFLTGGVFTTLKELVINVIQWIIRFLTNIVSIFLFPIVNLINNLLPNIDDLNSKIEYVFNYVSPYINYILDLSFLSQAIINYLIASLIFRITIKNSTYLQKLIVKWYHKLAP